MHKTQPKLTGNAKPPRHHTEAGTKCPLLLKADIEKLLKSQFFNSLG